MKLKIITVFALVFSFLCITPVNANEGLWTIEYDGSDIYLLNKDTSERIKGAYSINEKGEKVDINLKEYQKMLNSMEIVSYENNESNDSFLVPREVPTYYYVSSFVKKGQTEVLGEGEKVSADVDGSIRGGTVTVSSSVTKSESFSISVGITFSIKNQIKSSISGSWNSTATRGATSGTSYFVPSNKIGWIEFRPRFIKVYGTSYYKKYSQSNVFISQTSGDSYGLSPKTLSNGILDGVYEYRERNK